MDVGVLGLSFKTADVAMREKMAKASRALFASEGGIPGWYQGILLLTCNRVEIYFSGDDLPLFHSRILGALRTEIDEPFEHLLYTYFGRDCFRHLARVTAGLDSAILAESEIQGQVKTAYEYAQLDIDLPSVLHFLFQKSLKIGKTIRSQFPSSRSRTTIADEIEHLVRHFFQGDLKMPILFIGNSQINRQILSHLFHKEIGDLTLCTRTVKAAEELGREFEVKVRDWKTVQNWSDYRLVICGSNCPQPLITLEDASNRCLQETMLILDLALPRNVQPELSRHPGIQLLNIDDLSSLVRRRRSLQMQELWSSLLLVDEEIDKQVAIYRYKSQRALVIG